MVTLTQDNHVTLDSGDSCLKKSGNNLGSTFKEIGKCLGCHVSENKLQNSMHVCSEFGETLQCFPKFYSEPS